MTEFDDRLMTFGFKPMVSAIFWRRISRSLACALPVIVPENVQLTQPLALLFLWHFPFEIHNSPCVLDMARYMDVAATYSGVNFVFNSRKSMASAI